MKAVVLEIRGKEAVVLKEDGTIEKIIRDCQIGDEIVINEKAKIVKITKRYIAVAASFVIAIILGFSGYAYAAPESYVTMDANLSFEFALNAFDEVVSMKALSQDGEKIVNDYNNKVSFHPSLNEAITVTSELLYDNNYLSTDKSDNIIISAVSTDNQKSLALSETAKTAFNEVENKYGNINEIATTIGTQETRSQAISAGVSTGRYIKDTAASKSVPAISETEAPVEKKAASEAVIASSDSDEKVNTTATVDEDDKPVVANSDGGAVAAVDADDAKGTADGVADAKDKETPAISADDKNSSIVEADDKNVALVEADDKDEADTKEAIVEN